MKLFFKGCLLLVLPLFFIKSVIAHHSAAPFDFTGTITISGLVKEFSVLNPHSVIVLEVTDDERGTRDIEFEGMSASVFYRAGYIKSSVNQNDNISMTIAPRHDGGDGGFVMSFITVDGQDI
jgi:hypothetical protein